VLPFLILALIDGGMTVYGTSSAIGGPLAASLLVGLIVGAGILVTLLSTFDIWGSWHPVLRESAPMTQLLRTIWIIAFVYDWATSVVAILDIAGLGEHTFDLSGGLLHMLDANRVGLMRFGVGIVAGLVVCGSTLVVSFMAYNERREDVAEA
jgi:hypothetical protein